MSIKPLDMQVMLPKTIEVAKLQSENEHKGHIINHQQASSLHQQVETRLRQVRSQDKAQNAKINDRQEKEKGKKREGQKESKQEMEKNKPSISTARTSIIDIKL